MKRGVDLVIRVTVPNARTTQEAVDSLRNDSGGITIDNKEVLKVTGRPWVLRSGTMH